MTKKIQTTIIFLVAVLVLVMIVAAFKIFNAPIAPQKQANVQAPQVTTSQSQNIKGVIEITMKAGRFEPNTIRVLAGEKYKLKVKNIDNFPHSLVLLDLGIDTGRIEPGKFEEHEFIAPFEPSIFEFYSSIPGQRGMTGSLVVEKNPNLKIQTPPSL